MLPPEPLIELYAGPGAEGAVSEGWLASAGDAVESRRTRGGAQRRVWQ